MQCRCVLPVAITLSKWDLMERKRKEEEEAAGKQTSYDDIDGRSVDVKRYKHNYIPYCTNC